MTSPPRPLTLLEKSVLASYGGDWTRKHSGTRHHAVVARLSELGLLEIKRERGRRAGSIIATLVRRTGHKSPEKT